MNYVTKDINNSRSRQEPKSFLEYEKKFLVNENFIILHSPYTSSVSTSM